MNIQHQYLAAEHIGVRRREAEELRLGHQVARSRRLTRRAERVAERARLAAERLL
jgi:hypothetical protein